ncbi:WAT1-related protein At5g40240-like isoform X2 [Camellia sinensis]|nr:WAT1-related protein At5g40240-like isoform X2 [Camellia sinensis]
MVNGIGYASPTLASAMTNLTPVWTFLLAIVFRMEKLNLKAKGSQAKSSQVHWQHDINHRAFIVTLYKGPSIIFSLSSLSNSPHQLLLSPPPSWILGGFVLAVASFLKALLYIVQAWIIKDYLAEQMIILISSIFGTIISAVVCLIAERDLNAWKLRLDIELLAIGFSVCIGIIRNISDQKSVKKLS